MISPSPLIALAGVVIALAGFSRLYLGLHWPLDVVSGWLIGGVCAAAALGLVAAFPRVTVQTVPLPGVGLAVPLVLLTLHATSNDAKLAGAALGLIGGWWLERRMADRSGGRGGRRQTWLPLLSAGIVTLLGVGIAVQGLPVYLG